LQEHTKLSVYRQSRDDLLAQIAAVLSADNRFVAAWLTGSYGRGDADEVSDLDIRVVVAEPHSRVLCHRHEQVSHETTAARLELFSKFGKPALIHENNHNAPQGGTFTFVLYAGSALMVDWVMVPQEGVARPFESLLLFDKGNLPVSSPPVPEQVEESRKAVAEVWAFFWMMTAITIKYTIRGDLVFVQNWLEQLHGLVREIERRLERKTWQEVYVRGSFSNLQPTREKQIESLRQLMNRMQSLEPEIADFTGSELAAPLTEIEALLSLADERDARH
jgi:predicted nucleotidyltransferase